MYGFLSFFAFRTVIIFISTAFALAAVMLALNIITVDDLINILGLEPSSPQAIAIKQVVSRLQEVTGNVMTIISKLLNHLLSWAGIDANVNDIKININDANHGSAAPAAAPAIANPGSTGTDNGIITVNPN